MVAQKQLQNPTVKSSEKVRTLKPARRKLLRLRRRKESAPRIQSAPKIFVASLRILQKYWKGFVGIALVYLVLSLLLVRGFAGSDLPALKQLVTEALQGEGGDITVGFTVFGLLIGATARASSQVTATYQMILIVGISLTVIWALRQAHAGLQFGIKEAFYKAFYPLVPFLGVLLVIGVQLLPFLAASILYNVLFVEGLAQGAIERIVWAVSLGALVLWSMYMLTASMLALYVVTLPDMMPFKALRSARDLVRNRRWSVMRKMLFLPLVMLLIGVVIMLPAILLLTPIAEWVFIALSTLSLVAIHSYMYSLYRELL